VWETLSKLLHEWFGSPRRGMAAVVLALAALFGIALRALVLWYNLGRVHKSLRCTPAIEAGIADHVLSARELLVTA
jgi:hypothetical protein